MSSPESFVREWPRPAPPMELSSDAYRTLGIYSTTNVQFLPDAVLSLWRKINVGKGPQMFGLARISLSRCASRKPATTTLTGSSTAFARDSMITMLGSRVH